MASFNRVVIIGNVTQDIQLRYTGSGTAVCDLSLAINERRKQNNEWVEEVSFVEVTLWARTAEVAGEYLTKGSPVFIEGRLKQETWEKDGQKRSKLKVIGERMQLIGSRGNGGGESGGGQPSQGYRVPADPATDSSDATLGDDIPF